MPYWPLFYHLIWATKDREPLIGEREAQLIRRSFELTFDDLEAIPHAIGFMPDHVHVVVPAPPKVAPAELARRLKGASAHAVNCKGEGNDGRRFTGQGEYGVPWFDEQALADVAAYVHDQPTRHATGNIWSNADRAAGVD